MRDIDILEVLHFLSNKILNYKCNNYLFEELTAEDMQAIKKFLKENTTSSVLNKVDDDYGIKDSTENLIYDCGADDIDDLMNLKMYYFLPTMPKGYTTFHVLNLQALNNKEKLKTLYQAVKRINPEKGCFHLYTTEQLKYGAITLDRREDLLDFKDNGQSAMVLPDDEVDCIKKRGV